MSDGKVVDESKAISEIVQRLREQFPAASPESVTDAVEYARATFSGAKVRDFVPVLIEKEAKALLAGRA
ncbi:MULTISPECIES: three-helix bundle dimerization domain-containing protein [Bacteria]|jgi:hypothetical protein